MKYVLIACEESQVECSAFRARGFEAYSCDIQRCSGGHPEWHVWSDVHDVLRSDCHFVTQDNCKHYVPKWDLIIAHPPCTYLSAAGACRLFDSSHNIIDFDRLLNMVYARKFFMQFYNLSSLVCEHVCIENPTPLKIANLPECDQVIQPFHFGEKYSKRTCLWLDGLPPLMNIFSDSPHIPFVGNSKYIGAAKHDSFSRSKSFSLIAAAMAEQWGNYISGV